MGPDENGLLFRQALPGAFLAKAWPEDWGGPGSHGEAAGARARPDAGWDAPAAAQGAATADADARTGAADGAYSGGGGDWRPSTARLQAHVDERIRQALLGALQLLKEPVRRLFSLLLTVHATELPGSYLHLPLSALWVAGPHDYPYCGTA